MKKLLLLLITITAVSCNQSNVTIVEFEDEKSNAIRGHYEHYLNNDIANLLMITKKENMARNTIQRLPKELQQVMRLKCKLIKKINNNGTQQTK